MQRSKEEKRLIFLPVLSPAYKSSIDIWLYGTAGEPLKMCRRDAQKLLIENSGETPNVEERIYGEGQILSDSEPLSLFGLPLICWMIIYLCIGAAVIL